MSVLDFSDLKGTGQIIKYNNEPYQIIWSNFMRTAQRKPVIQTKLRNLITGKVMEYSFKYGEKVDGADVIKRKAQFLYNDDEGAHFMNPENYETFVVPKALVADQQGFLKEGSDVVIMFFSAEGGSASGGEEKPIGLELPIKMSLKVIETSPGVRGDTATGGFKPAKLETGLSVNVPLFIKEGDMVRVNTTSGDYVERSNE